MRIKRFPGRWLPVLFCSILSGPALADDGEGEREAPSLVVRAALVELPTTPPCEGRKIVRVTTRYRVERVLQSSAAAEIKPASTLLVVHRCPEFARGPSRYGNGKAAPLRAGHRHILRLAPFEPATSSALIDRFAEDRGPRFHALRTDPAPELPRIAVVYAGGAGASQRLDFDAEQVSIGRAPDMDVLLAHPEVALRHLRLQVREGGSGVSVRDLSGRGLRINGKRLKGLQPITAQDKIEVGPYSLHVSYFTPEEIGD